MIGEPTFADAILDRIVHNVYRFALEGRPTSRQIREPGLRLPRNVLSRSSSTRRALTS